MNIEQLKKIIDTFNKQGKMGFLEGVSEEQISVFENKNNCKLPNGYKEWLKFSDGGECFLPAGIQLYGISHKPVINTKDSNRPDETYTVIGALSTGDPILCQKGTEQISIYNSEANRIEDDETYPDFEAFLNDLYDLLGMGD